MAFPSHAPTVGIDDQAACGCSISQAAEPLSKYNLQQTRYALARDIHEDFHQPHVEQGHLCHTCIDMLSMFALTGGGDGKAFGEHHQRKETLLHSVEESCYMCMPLNRQLKDFSRVQWCVTPQDPMTAEHVSSYDVDFRTYQPDGSVKQMVSFVVRRLIETTPMMSTATLSRGQPSTGSPDTIDLIKMWLQLSIDGPKTKKEKDMIGEAASSPPSDDHWFPTRVLDVSGHKMRLIDTDQAKSRSPYATLSYCWGTRPFLRLTPETNDQLRAGIEIESLPILYQQAILITRGLGVQYLWIDAFCIIQGPSPEASRDFQAEAPLMGKVYSHGLFNIAADESTTPFEPLFRNRARSDVDPCHFSWEPWVCPRGMYRIEEQYETAMTLVRAHLHTRGWTHQERLLCTKMLHFGAHQVAWEYGSGIWNETYPDGLHLREAGRKFDIPQRIDSDLLYEEWTGVIRTYTERALTYPDKDKLMAVAAMARRYAEASDWEHEQQQYAAGHMRSSLLFSLCWQTNPGAKRTDVWRAPSWSWASIDGPLSFGIRSFRWGWVMKGSLAEVLDVKLEHEVPSDVYGPLKTGYLHLKAKLLDCPVSLHSREDMSLDAVVEDWILPGLSFQLTVRIDDDHKVSLHTSTARILPLMFCASNSGGHPGAPRDIYGLLVVPCPSTERIKSSVGEESHCRRLGLAKVTYRGKDKSTRSAEVEERILSSLQVLTEYEIVVV